MVNHMKEAFLVLVVLVLVFSFMGCEQVGKAVQSYKPITKTYSVDTPFHEKLIQN